MQIFTGYIDAASMSMVFAAVAGVAVTVDEYYFCFGVNEQQSYKFSGCIARSAYNSYSYHIYIYGSFLILSLISTLLCAGVSNTRNNCP